MRILFAEDERDLNDIITKKLVSEGYSVDSVYDGEEAMDILSYTDYDAVILDIMMPKASRWFYRAAGTARRGEKHARSVPDGARLRAGPRGGARQRRKRLSCKAVFG